VLNGALWLQRRYPLRQRYSLREQRTHALSTHARAPCERRRGTSRRAPPGTGDDVAASLCRRSATRRRCLTARKPPCRRQGCCPQRRAQETGVACCGRRRLGRFHQVPEPADRCLSPGRPSALSLQTRAAGRVLGADVGGAARSTQRARRHGANEPLSLPHAGRLEGSRGAPLRHDARCAARAGDAAAWGCARAVRTLQCGSAAHRAGHVRSGRDIRVRCGRPRRLLWRAIRSAM
jgi:hypothetical protein